MPLGWLGLPFSPHPAAALAASSSAAGSPVASAAAAAVAAQLERIAPQWAAHSLSVESGLGHARETW